MTAELYYGPRYLPDVPTNPLVNPWFAEDLSALPSHVISVNELDPLRDEGVMYYRRLQDQGNSCRLRIVRGTPHATDMIAMQAAYEIADSTLKDIIEFAHSL